MINGGLLHCVTTLHSLGSHLAGIEFPHLLFVGPGPKKKECNNNQGANGADFMNCISLSLIHVWPCTCKKILVEIAVAVVVNLLILQKFIKLTRKLLCYLHLLEIASKFFQIYPTVLGLYLFFFKLKEHWTVLSRYRKPGSGHSWNDFKQRCIQLGHAWSIFFVQSLDLVFNQTDPATPLPTFSFFLFQSLTVQQDIE